MNHARLLGEQRGGEDGQRGVFRAADADGAGERFAAVNENFIHSRSDKFLEPPKTVSRKFSLCFPPLNPEPWSCRGAMR